MCHYESHENWFSHFSANPESSPQFLPCPIQTEFPPGPNPLCCTHPLPLPFWMSQILWYHEIPELSHEVFSPDNPLTYFEICQMPDRPHKVFQDYLSNHSLQYFQWIHKLSNTHLPSPRNRVSRLLQEWHLMSPSLDFHR